MAPEGALRRPQRRLPLSRSLRPPPEASVVTQRRPTWPVHPRGVGKQRQPLTRVALSGEQRKHRLLAVRELQKILGQDGGWPFHLRSGPLLVGAGQPRYFGRTRATSLSRPSSVNDKGGSSHHFAVVTALQAPAPLKRRAITFAGVTGTAGGDEIGDVVCPAPLQGLHVVNDLCPRSVAVAVRAVAAIGGEHDTTYPGRQTPGRPWHAGEERAHRIMTAVHAGR